MREMNAGSRRIYSGIIMSRGAFRAGRGATSEDDAAYYDVREEYERGATKRCAK